MPGLLEQLANGLLNYARSEPDGLLARGLRQPAGLLGRGLNNAINTQGPGLLAQQDAFFRPSVMNTPEQTRADGAAFLQGIASGPLGMAPLGMSKIYYRGTNNSGEKITGGVIDGALFATPKENIARMYAGSSGKVEQIIPSEGAKILSEGSKEFASIVGRKDFLRGLKPGESLKDVINDAAAKAKASGYDAMEFSLTDGPEIAIFNRGAFK